MRSPGRWLISSLLVLAACAGAGSSSRVASNDMSVRGSCEAPFVLEFVR